MSEPRTAALPDTAVLLNRLSHVLAPSLMGVRASSEALIRQLPAHPEVRALADATEQAMAILDGMVRLQAAGREAVPERVDLGDALRAALIRVTANGRPCDVQAAGLDAVDADRAQVVTILAELLDNVATHAGGPAIVRSIRDGDVVRVIVSDTGAGLPARVDRAAPLVFRRGDVAARGAGCGLAICAIAAASNGGRLELRDGPLGGVEAEVVLPAASASVPPSPAG